VIPKDGAPPARNEQPEVINSVIDAAWHVVENAYGTNPRHTRGRDGGCRDDCIPCGIQELWAALARTERGQQHWLASDTPGGLRIRQPEAPKVPQ
jgi:hypothetical protein